MQKNCINCIRHFTDDKNFCDQCGSPLTTILGENENKINVDNNNNNNNNNNKRKSKNSSSEIKQKKNKLSNEKNKIINKKSTLKRKLSSSSSLSSNDENDSNNENEEDTIDHNMQKIVLNMCNSSSSELLKKYDLKIESIDIVLNLRPFSSYNDLCSRLKDAKEFEVIHSITSFLKQNNILPNILRKVKEYKIKFDADIEETLINQPKLLNDAFMLQTHQLEALAMLVKWHKHNINGILADEMGLGKTITVIALLAYLRETSKIKPTHFIVVTPSTIDNWFVEFAKWFPDCIVYKYTGNESERENMRSIITEIGKSRLTFPDVILTTYPKYRKKITEEEKNFFKNLNLSYCIMDEAQNLKNMKTETFKNLNSINSEHKLLLTGTPIQNNVKELFTLMSFIMPDVFDNVKNMIKIFEQSHAKLKSKLLHLTELINTFILRRLLRSVHPELNAEETKVIDCSLQDNELKI